jgi:hypothetical protein
MRRSLYRVLRFAPGLAVAAILMFPTAALASGTSIQVVSAKLLARGAALNLTVSFTCPAGDVVPTFQQFTTDGLSVFVQQAVNRTQMASGNGGTGGQTCTGAPQTAVISVLTSHLGPPFHRGPAVAVATLIECDPTFSTCTSTDSALTVIRIHR